MGGQLVETRSYFAANEIRDAYDQEGEYAPIHIGGWLSGMEQYTYDADGRVRQQTTLDRPEGEWWSTIGWFVMTQRFLHRSGR